MYFGEGGISYNLGRIHINSCDFSLESYSFDDVPGDYEVIFVIAMLFIANFCAQLNNFDMTVQHDQKAMLPFLRAAIDAMSPSSIDLKLLASPWSPPAWMKAPQLVAAAGSSNDTEAQIAVQSMLGSASPNGLIATSNIQSTWANYISLFIEAYYQQGVPIWAVTPQNEPEFAAPWEACTYTPQFEADFIQKYLGPTLETDHPEVYFAVTWLA